MTTSEPPSTPAANTTTDTTPTDPAADVNATLLLARVGVDRRGERRTDPDLFRTLASSPTTRYLPLRDGQAPVRDGHLVLLEAAPAGDGTPPIYLGATTADGAVPAGTDVVLVQVPGSETAGPADAGVYQDDHAGSIVPGAQWRGLRDAADDLDAVEAGLFVESLALHHWHRVHTHCPRCGAPTEATDAGWVRRCTADGSQHFPRTDPAIICTVIDDEDRLLLGRSAQWPANRFSTLAGFVEPGESLEAAVIREIGEEAGIAVDRPRYLGSQPWPFPCSLMLGYTAHAVGTKVVPDGVEILDLRWFTRQELAAAVDAGEVRLPGTVSIARRLIEHWYGEPMDEPEGSW
ncbi:NAD(+) diphosphatase [Tersicoccus sp. MR15.9]|uniref:NAD(+) diphosphatase n=1 Tax=Tersicoccus mangrovi TaxID=3121635 RepID=UPI002FE5A676